MHQLMHNESELTNQSQSSLGTTAIVIIFVRRHLPESPRWQVMHGRADEAEESISFMEHEVQEKTGRELPPVDESKAIDVKAGEDHGYLTLLRVLFREYPTRSVLGATMMITQSFLSTPSAPGR